MDWKNKISGCFGLSDRSFAGHPSDEERAFELLSYLRKDHVGWAEFSEALVNYLDNCTELHTTEQVRKVEQYFRPWLLD